MRTTLFGHRIRWTTLLLSLALCSRLCAGVMPIIDLLTPNGFGVNNDNNTGQPASDFPPEGSITLDFYAGLEPGNQWYKAGLVARLTDPAASILYFPDPNTGEPAIVAPESVGSPTRHVSFVSMPGNREANVRFRDALIPGVRGGFDPRFPGIPEADGMNFNVAFERALLVHIFSGGFVGRVTIDVSQVLADRGLGPDDFFLGQSGEPGLPLANLMLASRSVEDPTFHRIDLTLYAVPEPATLLLLAFGGLLMRTRR